MPTIDADAHVVESERTWDYIDQADQKYRPLIVKPRFAYQWRQKGLWEKVGAQKAFITATREDLRALYPRLSVASEEVLLQEYVSDGEIEPPLLPEVDGRR